MLKLLALDRFTILLFVMVLLASLWPISPSTLVKIPLREALTSVELGNLVE